MTTSSELLEWQRDQYEHDMRNHFDILSLHKQDRLKHYAMHFGKYAGRVARGAKEEKPLSRTFADAMLVCLSAANTLHQRLAYSPNASNESFFIRLTDAQGRMNDAAEKIDHMENYVDIATAANQDILNALLDLADLEDFDTLDAINARRAQLRERHFYIR
jgi:hypothetical protein